MATLLHFLLYSIARTVISQSTSPYNNNGVLLYPLHREK
jgi:hypothetical protein